MAFELSIRTLLFIALAFVCLFHVRIYVVFSRVVDYDQQGGAKHPYLDGNAVTALDKVVHLRRQQQQKPGLRTLVILTGGLRLGEPGWKTLYKNLLEPSNADLALLLEEDTPEAYREASVFKKAKYHWTVPMYKDWADAFDLVHNSSEWREKLYPIYEGGFEMSNNMLGGIQNASASGGIVFMFRWLLRQKLIENGLVNKYDNFLVTRTDQVFECPFSVPALSSQLRSQSTVGGGLWVPTGEDYGGINDRLFIADSATILQALDTLSPVLADPVRYEEQLTTKDYNSEQFLLYRWIEDGLIPRRFPRTMFTGAAPRDSARWRQPMEAQAYGHPGVHLKYGPEYLEALKGCGHWMRYTWTMADRWAFPKKYERSDARYFANGTFTTIKMESDIQFSSE